MNTKHDSKGRFSPKVSALIAEAEEIETQATSLSTKAVAVRAAADEMIAAETNAPEWLRALVVAIADSLGISPEEFRERIRIVHPTPADPVLLVDGKPVVAWI